MKNVLITDDAVFMRATLKQILLRNGFNVIGEAENGRVAVSLYNELKPDIVMLDITMPEMNGIEALKEIKKLDPAAKVLMVSAIGNEGMVREAIIAGAKGFVVKPFNEGVLVKALGKV